MRHYRNFGYKSPRTKLRLLTGMLLSNALNGQDARAARLAQEALSLLERLPDATPLERGRLLVAQGVSQGRMRTEEGYEAVQAGLTLISSARHEHHPDRLRALDFLTTHYVNKGDHEATMRHGRALMNALTQPLSEPKAPEASERLAWLELAVAKAMGEAGEKGESMRLAEAGFARLKARFEGRPNHLGMALVRYADICLSNRERARATKAAKEAMALVHDASLKTSVNLELNATLVMARAMRAHKKKRDALALFRRAVEIASQKAKDHAPAILAADCSLYAMLKEVGAKEEAATMQPRLGEQAKAYLPSGSSKLELCVEGKRRGY